MEQYPNTPVLFKKTGYQRNGIVLISFLCVFVLAACSQDHHDHSHNHDHHSHSHNGNHSTSPSQIQTLRSFSSQTLEPNRNEEVTIQIKDNAGKPIEKFEISHEKKMHWIVVSKDLSYFNHIHPEYVGNGEFKVTTMFPQGGDYKLFADFVLQGFDHRTESQWITVKGDVTNQPSLQPDSNF